MEKTGIRIEALGLQLIENNTEDIKRIKVCEYVDGQWVVKVIWRQKTKRFTSKVIVPGRL